LTIVRTLVERHGGTVSAHCDGAGRGSEFVVRLPKANSDARGDGRPSDGPAMAKLATDDANALRILVVDDNQDNAEMLAEALRSYGYQARVTLDAPAALRVAESFAPHIALLDIGLPTMDGYELAGLLKKVPGLANIRLIALTGYGQESDRQKTRAAGFHHHLVKPVDLKTLQALLAAP
jgi:CheY-like chemotaxis protein